MMISKGIFYLRTTERLLASYPFSLFSHSKFFDHIWNKTGFDVSSTLFNIGCRWFWISAVILEVVNWFGPSVCHGLIGRPFLSDSNLSRAAYKKVIEFPTAWQVPLAKATRKKRLDWEPFSWDFNHSSFSQDQWLRFKKLDVLRSLTPRQLFFSRLFIKMAIILPTGQWYAPSAVINDAWYCMVLHCIA